VNGTTDGLGDFLVACVESGDVRVLSAVLPTPRNGPAEQKDARETIYRVGHEARISGRHCPTCRLYGVVQLCEYRPLRGPLFVPR
jgi:hypothetical protein